MRGLSKQAERAVMAALDDATELVEAGEHPTAALIKAAQKHTLEAGHARLAAIAYNTGRASFERDAAHDTHAKLADYELADPDLVAAGVARVAKTASQATDGVSSEYAHPPTFLWDAYRQKRAEIELQPLADPSALPMPRYDNQPAKDCAEIRAQQRKIAEGCAIVDKLHRALEESVTGLLSDFRALGSPSVHTLRKAAQLKNHRNVIAVLDELTRRCPTLDKVAASTAPYLTVAEQRLYAKTAEVAEQAAKVVDSNKMLTQLQETGGAKIAALAQRNLPDYTAQDPFGEINAEGLKRAAGPDFRRAVYPFLGGMMGASDGGIKPMDDANVRAYMLALDDPAHEQKLQAIRARTVLERLMATDPVLRGYPQDEVVNAFNQLSQSAPSAVTQPLYVQSMLRRYLGQSNALDVDDVRSNIMAPQKDLLEQRMRAAPTLPETARVTGLAEGGARRQAVRDVMSAISGDRLPAAPRPDPVTQLGSMYSNTWQQLP